MPQLIPAIGAGISWLFSNAAAAILTRVAISIAVSAIAGRAARRRAARSLAEQRANQTVMVRSSTEPRKIVYGSSVISGPLAFAETTGAGNSNLHIVIPLCEGPIESVDEVYIDDEAVGALDGSWWAATGRWVKTDTNQGSATTTVAGDGSWSVTLPSTPQAVLRCVLEPTDSLDPWLDCAYTLTGLVVAGTGQPPGRDIEVVWTYQPTVASQYLRAKHYLGSTTQVADTDLIAAAPTKWTSDHRLRGIAYLYMVLVRDETVFPTGLGNIKAKVKGRKLYDPRDGVTRWSMNPALAIRDYLTASYGLGCSSGEIDDATFIAAANICDEPVASAGSSGFADAIARGALEVRYSCNGAIDLSRSRRDNLEDLLQTCMGELTYSEGKWRLHAASYVTPTITLTERDLAGYASVQPRAQRRDLFNAVQGVYVSLENAGAVSDFPAYKSATYAAADGDELMRDVDLPMTASGSEAQRLARLMVELGRRSMTFQADFNLRQCLRLQAGDAVLLNFPHLGITNKGFVVKEWGWNIPGTISMVLREDDTGAYSWNHLTAAEIPPPLASALPSPFTRPAAPTGFQLLSGEQYAQRNTDGSVMVRIAASWTASIESAVITGGRVELELRRTDETEVAFASAAALPGDTASTYLGPVQSEASYVGRIRFVNSIGVASDWAYDTVLADGKTSGPQTPTSLAATGVQAGIALTWSNPTDSDFDRIEIWTNTIDQVVSATKVETVRAATWLHFGLAAGTVRYYWIRALDRHGNSSSFTSSVNATALGITGKALELTFPAQAFVLSSAGVATPTSIVLTANKRNGLTGTVTFSVVSGTYSGSLTAVGDTLTVSPASMTTKAVTFRATVTDGVAYTDDVTLVKVQDGAPGSNGTDGITIFLTNESHTLPTNSSDAVTSYSGADGALKIYDGGTDVSTGFGAVYQATGAYSGFSSAPSGTINTSTGVYTVSSGLANTAATAWVEYQVTYGGTVYGPLRFSISKAKIGANGGNGSDGVRGSRTLYRTNAAYTATYNNGAGVGLASYRAQATTEMTAATGSSTKVEGDTVTFTNGTSYATTLTWSVATTNWELPGTVIDGSLLVTGTVTTAALVAGTLTGFTIRTQISGARLTLNESANNSILGYDSGGTVKTRIDADIGYIIASNATSSFALNGSNTGTTGGGVGGSSLSSSGYAVRGSGGSGAGVRGDALTGFGGYFTGNTTKAPLYLESLAALPSDRSLGAICVYSGNLCFANGTHWFRVDGLVQLT